MNPTYSWLDGKLTPWADSKIHINSDAVLRGASVFEGLRAYLAADGSGQLNVFRFEDHLDRLFGVSTRVLRMKVPYSRPELLDAVLSLLRANEVRGDAHIRLVAYFGELATGAMGSEEDPVGVYALAFERPSSPKLKSGIRSMVSAWRRPSDNALSPRVKASANYLNSRLAAVDARLKGFDIPVMLNERGKVSEGPGQNIFLVRDGALLTPRITDAILEGITRETVLSLARDLGLSVEEREIDATELYVAEEIFFCGTAMEVQPVIEIDGYTIGSGSMGAVTARLQEAYFALVRGETAAPAGWLTPVYPAATSASTAAASSSIGSV